MACTEIPYYNPDGSANPLGGYCAEDVAGMPTMGGVPATNYNGQWFPRFDPGPSIPIHGTGGGGGNPSYPNSPPTGSGFGPGAATAGGIPTGYAPLFDPFTAGGSSSGGSSSGGGCDLIPNVYARELCKIGVGYYNQQQNKPSTECPKGYHKDAKTGGCVIDGPGSYLPGDIGRPDYVWTPINGRYGAGVTPIALQLQKRACPSGYVLGKDGVCYDHLARTNRAHNPGAKPFLSGGDMNALRKAHSLQKTITKLNRRFGKKTPKPCGPRKKR